MGQVIVQAEPDDSIPTANATGLTATAPGIRVAYGNNADGAHGYGGDETGDFDFFKVSAAAGQTILIDLKNDSTNRDFDSLVILYKANGDFVADNDDVDRPGARSSRLEYVIPAGQGGDYYFAVGNWVEGSDGRPSNPAVAGTGPGLPGGTGGPYKAFISVGAAEPIIEFDGLGSNNPVPTLVWTRVPGSNIYRQTAQLRLTNTGTADYELNGYTLTGADATRFSVTGPTPPLDLAPGASITLTLNYEGVASPATGTALLDISSNDPFNTDFPIAVANTSFTGGGFFTVRQINAPAGSTLGSLSDAYALLQSGTPGSSITEESPVINYNAAGADGGYIGGDRPFPNSAAGSDNFVTISTGQIFIRQAGTYTFRGIADDGQRLTIDGVQIFEGTAANVPVYQSYALTAGEHTLEYVQYEGGGGEAAELSISQLQGDFTTAGSPTTWELVEAYSPDSDGDGLPNGWEIANGLDPEDPAGAEGATGDPDGDGLNNLAEFIAATHPQMADTDADGYNDGVETKTGIFVSATDTGTDPLIPDSDGDGLLDGVEDPNEVSTGVSQPGSDPNKVDTDGDTFPDFSEVTLGTDPKSAASVPTLAYSDLLADNFDGVAVNSTYAFTTSDGTFTPAVTATGVVANGNAAQITSASNSNNNSIAFDSVAAPARQSVRLTYDFRMGSGDNVADGIGIGLFRTSAYGTTGAINPAVGKNWENPASAAGYADAVVFGFSIFGSDFIRMSGPAAPGVALKEVASPFVLTNNLFNRVIITGVTNGGGDTMFSMEVIEDVNGTAISHQIFSNVLVKGFDLPNEDFRLIAGGRTGGFFTRMDLDNLKLATATVSTGAAPTISIAKAGSNVSVTYTGVLQSSPDLVTFTDVPAATSPYTVPVTAASKMFYRARQE